MQIQSNVLTPVFNFKNANDRVLFITDGVLCTAPKVCYRHVKNLEPEQKRLHVMQMRVEFLVHLLLQHALVLRAADVASLCIFSA